ncbi:MAG: hypothetical protein JW839_03680 [Candidatus Lokiarchaeota archaeon]|nr:hypothetical protein [Candidatus Lokiarchaeota archaeon]
MECEVCKRNIVSANHYCYDCHTIFCDACVVKEREEIQVCSECGLNFFATDEKSGQLFCRQCKEEGLDNARIVAVQREKMVCPKCRSPNTSEIDELKGNLKEKYKNIVIDSRNVLQDFSSFTGLLSTAKQKLMKLRLELPVMLHEPGMEQELLGLIEEGALIERRIMKRINHFFLFLRSKKGFFVDGKAWSNQDVAVLETYINQLQSDFMSFTAQVSESFNQPLEMLQSLKDRIDFLLTIKDFFIKYMNKGVIGLDKAEYPVIHVEEVKLDSDDEEHKGHGHVLLTTKSFKFIKSQGYLKKTDALLFSFPVTKLLSTDVVGRIFKRLSLQFQGIGLRFNMDKAKMQVLAKYFEQLLDFEQINKLDQDKIQRIKAFDVNSVFKIKAYIEENINALLNPGDASALPTACQYMGGQPTGAAAATDIDMELEQVLDLAGNDTLRQGPTTSQATGNNMYPSGGLSLDGLAGNYVDASFFPPGNAQPDPVSQGFLKHPAISTGDARFFRPVYGRGQGQSQQVVNQAYPQVALPFQAPSYAPGPASPACRPPAPIDAVPAWGLGTSNGVRQQSVDAYQQQVIQARIQKAQEIHMLMSQLQAVEQRIVSIKETMRNLEAKFELGKIAANVYFSTHQLFSEKMISLDHENQVLHQRLASVQSALQGQQF